MEWKKKELCKMRPHKWKPCKKVHLNGGVCVWEGEIIYRVLKNLCKIYCINWGMGILLQKTEEEGTLQNSLYKVRKWKYQFKKTYAPLFYFSIIYDNQNMKAT